MSTEVRALLEEWMLATDTAPFPLDWIGALRVRTLDALAEDDDAAS